MAKREESEAAKKVAKAEKADGGAPKKERKEGPGAFQRGGKAFVKFWKDFRGECKKIVWPDFKTVMKNTGIVLLTVLFIGIMVWVVDIGLTQGIRGLKALANKYAVTDVLPPTKAEETPTQAPTQAPSTAAPSEAVSATQPVTE
ncbi:MAG: preprotein translocase subunit SecE [Oscillospiraceae bacterium]|jgi:preprotein translocase subunit SecE|nr:preprotein translocase subunit SecE [Oscillospiraceae bacterium]